ncbi:hypothetical protein LIER_44013 [Lithospermum erythrorhizon]|uniref:Uncharacterized protein n=1 Tax=Lithospermum erythrorhizon TaxID=34254 RepID=A0AAV3RM92_LITER
MPEGALIPMPWGSEAASWRLGAEVPLRGRQGLWRAAHVRIEATSGQQRRKVHANGGTFLGEDSLLHPPLKNCSLRLAQGLGLEACHNKTQNLVYQKEENIEGMAKTHLRGS